MNNFQTTSWLMHIAFEQYLTQFSLWLRIIIPFLTIHYITSSTSNFQNHTYAFLFSLDYPLKIDSPKEDSVVPYISNSQNPISTTSINELRNQQAARRMREFRRRRRLQREERQRRYNEVMLNFLPRAVGCRRLNQYAVENLSFSRSPFLSYDFTKLFIYYKTLTTPT